MKFRQCLLFAIPLLSAACASLDSGPYKFSEGWRSGVVEEVSTAGALAIHKPDDCRYEVGASYPASTPFALVSYRSNRITKHRMMPVPKGMTPNVGDAVLVSLNQCNGGLTTGGVK